MLQFVCGLRVKAEDMLFFSICHRGTAQVVKGLQRALYDDDGYVWMFFSLIISINNVSASDSVFVQV